jgi:hypothetical protein
MHFAFPPPPSRIPLFKVKIKVYMVPEGCNHLARLLCTVDSSGLYKRVVYHPFVAPLPFFPMCRGKGLESVDMSAPAEAVSAYVTPNNSLRHFLHHFMRSADYVYPVQVFECECWSVKDGEKGDGNEGFVTLPDVVIPFCIRADIGIVPFTHDYMRKNGIPLNDGEAVDWPSMLGDKSFQKALQTDEYLTPDVVVNYKEVAMSGELNEKRTELRSKQYVSLTFSNSPSTEDDVSLCNSSSANQQCLEIQTQEKHTSVSTKIKNPLKYLKKPEDVKTFLQTCLNTENVPFFAGLGACGGFASATDWEGTLWKAGFIMRCITLNHVTFASRTKLSC